MTQLTRGKLQGGHGPMEPTMVISYLLLECIGMPPSPLGFVRWVRFRASSVTIVIESLSCLAFSGRGTAPAFAMTPTILLRAVACC